MKLLKSLAISAMLLSPVAASAETIRVALPNGKYIAHSDIPLSAETKKHLRDIRKNTNFNAAIYLNKSNGKINWATGMHSLSIALQDAKSVCRLYGPPADCVLYATIVPRNAPEDVKAITLNKRGAKDFRTYQRRQSDGKFGAFAINSYYSYGYSWGFATEVEAREGALLECKAAATKGLANAAKRIRDGVVKKSRLRCRVMHVTQP